MDTRKRPLRSLRVSVTDRCNLRCQYCMPEVDYVWLPRKDVLSFEETRRLVGVFTGLGVDKVRLTGGEPLLRKDLPELVRMLSDLERVHELALTTNGLLLEAHARSLKDAGLSRVTVSIDTLRPDRFRELSRRDQLDDVLRGIEAAADVGFDKLKLDTVVIRGTNEDEVCDLIDYAQRIDAEVRFIEYMDVGGATRWSDEQVFSEAEILRTVEEHFGGPIAALHLESWAPAKRYCLPNGTTFGIIATMTAPFCRTCDRSRLTADGLWYLCLYAQKGIDLRREIRRGATDEELTALVTTAWQARDDRGAEVRRELSDRNTPVEIEGLRKDPHLEMHTRGG
ncbi:MAG: GTP 3',8-cyclase MoaA [Acidobacteriota bacterium]|nr:MAG: GTP 3',8-cyclase MoaA [Acidobacteriota bacterium]